jgi:subtilisin family serine protease
VSRFIRARAKGQTLAILASAGLVAATLSTAGAASAAPPPSQGEDQFEAGRYVVVMKDEPVIGYDGDVRGFAATQPAEGQKFEADSPAAKRYRGHLKGKQDQALKRAGNPKTLYRYTNSISGFAADLTARQASELAKDPAVLTVAKNEIMKPDTNASPAFLGLSGKKGVWSELGGATPKGGTGAGAGVVVGVIDTGIRPESPSFADNGMPAPSGWKGECETGPGFPASSCNNKLIGARYFVDGFGENRLADYESVSPLDMDGHGTHTASTSAGNNGVRAEIDGRDLGTISGMAPAAHVAAYKVCWDDNAGGGGCATADSVAAIDQAVADGVDVLNFSISGTTNNFLAPVELAFMFAADAGVFVAASSGNSGPGASTTNHPSPWLTTVAASTHVVYEKTLVTGDGQRFIGSSVAAPLPAQTPMVLSDKIAKSTSEAGVEDARLCVDGSLDESKAAGKLVVCDRGVTARIDKSLEVKRAGGAGIVLVNREPGSLDNDAFFVPGLHLDHTKRDALRTYVEGTQNPTGAIEDTNVGSDTKLPEVAPFSSRGPTDGAGGDLLKPDISAPGVGVLAAYSPRAHGRSFDFASGTSMSSPHIAGLAAHVKQAHPTWSPMAVKSAMMTTARDHASAESNDLFAGGAGFVEPRRFLDPGLVYDSKQSDWWAFLAGQGVTYSDGSPVSLNPIDASDLNLASIAIGDLVGEQTITRTVTNVATSGGPATYKASVTGLQGIDVKVEPAKLQLRPGQSASFKVTFTTNGAKLGQYAQGHLVWKHGNHTVRSPIAVKPVAASAPAIVNTAVDATDVGIEVRPGYTGTMSASVLGLAKGEVANATATNTGGATFNPADERNYRQNISVPAGTFATRVEVKSPNPTQDDLDLFIQRVGGGIVAQSAAGGSDEIVTAVLPAGDYVVHVQAWSVKDNADTTSFDVRTFQVPNKDTGVLAFNAASQQVKVGAPVTFTGTLSTDKTSPYFGIVDFSDGSTRVARTFVSVG